VPPAVIAVGNLALWQQLAVLQVSGKRPRLRKHDRVFWVWLSRLWSGWRSCLMIVKPETVIRWHREDFRLYWRWKSRKKLGRPKTEAQIRMLILQMARQNPLCGAPRIQSELALLGHDVAESTVAEYMGRAGKPPSQTWRTFLENHVPDIAAIDFFVVATISFRLLYCFHESRAHLSLDRNAPMPRAVESPIQGRVTAIPHVGGLHHRYARAA